MIYETYNSNTLDLNKGGTVSKTFQTLAPVTGTALSSAATAAIGYYFVGWFESGADYANDTPVKTSDEFTPSKVSGAYMAQTYVAVFAETLICHTASNFPI